MHQCSLHLHFCFFKRLVMAYSSRFCSLPSCSSSSERTHSEPNEVRDVGNSDQEVDLVSRPPCYPNYEWVDPRVIDIPTFFRGSSALDGSLYKILVLKLDCLSDVVAVDSCNHTDQIFIIGKMVFKTFSLFTLVFLMICM